MLFFRPFYAVPVESVADAGVQNLADVPQVRDLLRGGQTFLGGLVACVRGLRATSKRHGEITFCSTCAPRALSFSTVSSVDPVSSTQMSSASDIESMKRSTNCDSFLQMA